LWKKAISFIYTEKAKPIVKESLSWVEKVSWYTAKVAMSVGELKANPSKENLEKLDKTLSQIADRLKLPYSSVDLVKRLAGEYVRADENTRRQLRKEINMAVKMLVADIMMHVPEEAIEEEE